MTNEKEMINQNEQNISDDAVRLDDPFTSDAPAAKKIAVIGETCRSCEG